MKDAPRKLPAAVTVLLTAGALFGVTFLLAPPADSEVASETPPVVTEAAAEDGTMVVTIDSSDPETWVGFSFASGEIQPAGADADIYVQRFMIRAPLGAVDLGEVELGDAVVTDPQWTQDESVGGEVRNTVLSSWYSYGYLTHTLQSLERVYAVQTADGIAYLRMESYQCPGSEPGCLTLRYRLMSDGAQDWEALYDAWNDPDPIPDFELLDHEGRPFRLGRYSDSWVVVGFVYTHCQSPTACPLTMSRMAGVQKLWDEEEAEDRTGGVDLQLLTLTFDAARDGPDALKAYGEMFGADFGSWTLATGPDELMNDALPALFGVLALPFSGGQISHSVKVALLKPGLELAAEWPDNAFEPADVVAEILEPEGDP